MKADNIKTSVNKMVIASGVEKPYLYPNPANDNFTIMFPPSYSDVVEAYIINFGGKALLVNNYHIACNKLRPLLHLF